jgi:hypothetical protein
MANGKLKRVPAKNGDQNKLAPEDRPAHDWYRFVLSYPPHLVRDYLDQFGIGPRHCVLDPFCGTGTTLVECKKLAIPSMGIEANPFACFAGQVKTDWSIDPDGLTRHATKIADEVLAQLDAVAISDEPCTDDDDTPLFKTATAPAKRNMEKLRGLPADIMKLLLTGSISPLPLHKTLTLLDGLTANTSTPYQKHEMLALAKALVFSISNLHFGPEVGVQPPKPDASVIAPWLRGVKTIAKDLRELSPTQHTPAVVNFGDAREPARYAAPRSIDAVLTSPPYPNEKDYTRTTRLESVLLGFISSKADLRALKKQLVRSNTRSVYMEDDDDKWIADHPEIQGIAKAIEERRLALGKTSGFERMYHRVAKLYFGGMARHLASLRPVLRRGAQLAYVVGDQASYLRVMIRTGRLLAEIAEGLGYKLNRIDLFRTRLSTTTKEQLREEVVVLKWPG